MQGINIRTKSREAALTDLIKKKFNCLTVMNYTILFPKSSVLAILYGILAQIDTKRWSRKI